MSTIISHAVPEGCITAARKAKEIEELNAWIPRTDYVKRFVDNLFMDDHVNTRITETFLQVCMYSDIYTPEVSLFKPIVQQMCLHGSEDMNEMYDMEGGWDIILHFAESQKGADARYIFFRYIDACYRNILIHSIPKSKLVYCNVLSLATVWDEGRGKNKIADLNMRAFLIALLNFFDELHGTDYYWRALSCAISMLRDKKYIFGGEEKRMVLYDVLMSIDRKARNLAKCEKKLSKKTLTVPDNVNDLLGIVKSKT